MAAEDLTTLANVREALQFVAGETNDDALIGSYITRASHAIMRYTQREFAPATASATRRFEVYGYRVSLAPYDLRSVTSVTLHPDDSSPKTVTSSEYRLEPVTSSDGVYTRVLLSAALDLGGSDSDVFGTSVLSIAGAWGFTSVPEDVEHAAISTVASWLRRESEAIDVGFDGGGSDGLAPRPTGTWGLPRSVRARLDGWRRVVLA